MHPINRSAGFTIVETLVVLAILAVGLKLGVPPVAAWLRATKIQSANEFYAEGFRQARAEAIKHKASSRIVLTTNATSGQYDYQIDLCFPTPIVSCANAASWSTTTAVANGDPEMAAGYKSVLRTSDKMPTTNVLTQTIEPAGADDVYYNSLGWVDTTFAPRIARLVLAPTGVDAQIPATAIAITLSGIASKCRPGVALHDSRKCPQ
ncbi:MAG: prepilin-type N-terminal cleavage/methylation domain-containing protein [Pseudomonadota bacterium]